MERFGLMRRVLFVTPFAGGNVTPTLGIASALAGAGNDVRILGHPQLESAVAESGLSFRSFLRARPWTPIVDRPGTASMLGWLRLASDRGIARDVEAELRRAPADVVVVDCMVPVALRPARRSGSPVVLLLHAFSSYWQEQWRLASPMGAW
jgi:UDP:flavonoid glycosyltransferase YjiC (YdhE family)